MLAVLLTTMFAATAQDQPSASRAPTVLLIALDAKDDKATEDFKTAFPLTTREAGVLFDLDGNGKLEQVAWTPANAAIAFLGIDKNENGIIDDGRELVGEQVLEGAANAIHALSKLPQSQDDCNQGGPAWHKRHRPCLQAVVALERRKPQRNFRSDRASASQ